MNYIATGGAAAASFCAGPQAAACAAIAGTALATVGVVELYNALVNADWDAYRAYEASIAAANEGRYPPPAIATPGAPTIPTYPDTREDENPWEGDPIWTRTEPPSGPPQGPNWSEIVRRLIETGTGLWRLLDLLRCPQTQPATPTATPTLQPSPTPKACDPQRVMQWMAQFQPRPLAANANWQRYQIRVAGPNEYPVVHNGISITADGIRTSDCSFLESKYVSNPRYSAYVPGTIHGREDYVAGVHSQTLDLISRYSAIVNDPSSPIVRLEIITNHDEARPFFAHLLGGTPGAVVIIP